MKNVGVISMMVAALAVLADALIALDRLGNPGFAVLIIVIGCVSGVVSGIYVRRRRAINRR